MNLPNFPFVNSTTKILLAITATSLLPMLNCSAWSPGTQNPSATAGFSVNRTDRRDVLAFHNTIYNASEGFASRMNWTGNVTTGPAGTTSAGFKGDVLRRINYYRALSGLPADIFLNNIKSAKCQEAALMFSAMSSISHTPPSSWTHYSANASEAAANSNIAYGTYGPESVNAYMWDDGASNYPVGHRRWLLYSRAQEMGTGDVPASASKPGANAIWVIGDHKAAPSPSFVAWPNNGFVPRTLVPARWSLSYPNANFGSATVNMTRNGTSVSLSINSRSDNGYGENTLVWTPSGITTNSTADQTYQVTVSNISGTGVPTSLSYSATIFDPQTLGEFVTVSGPSIASSGTSFTFNSITQADQYQLRVSRESSTVWTEGAEDSPTPAIINGTSASYSFRQSTVKNTGSKAFHLTFPSLSESTQFFEIDRDIIPGANSTVTFRDLFRYSTTGSRLSLEASADGGIYWTELWGRNGNGNTSSSGWDTTFQSRSAALSAFSGKPTRIRFVYRYSGSAFVGNTTTSGVFIDDISVNQAGELVGTTVTTLSSSESGFVLNATTAGSALLTGEKYHLRIRPQVGTVWFEDGPLKIVSATFAGPEIAVLNPQSQSLLNGSDLDGLPPALAQGQGAPVSITIRNDGDVSLSQLSLSKNGSHPTDFQLGALGQSSLAPGQTTNFTVTFTPTAGGNRSARVLIFSNDADENPFLMNVAGFGLSTSNDSDGDGLNDEAEFKMTALGFDWQLAQSQLVASLFDNAPAAGLHTTSQIQGLNIGIPLISKNATSGKFELTVGLRKSTNLQTFQHFSLNNTDTTIEPDGQLKIRFSVPDNAAFFRIQAEP